jgi:hypothetical protein
MKFQFLCAAHREQVQVNVGKAIQLWQVGYDTGQFYRDHLLWNDAIPHLGCAFETAEILLTHKYVEHELSCEWFTSSAMLLASCFTNTNSPMQANEIIWMTINRLEKELVDNSLSNIWINRYLQQLYTQLYSLMAAASVNGRQDRPGSSVNS